MHRLKISVAAFLCLPFLLFGEWQAHSEEEALFLRRIADFWQEGEYLVAKSQIEEFLRTYPQSEFSDTLQSALGDLLLREKYYAEALERYTQLRLPEMQKQSFLNRMQCLYHLGWYATLADECEKFLNQTEEIDSSQRLQSTYLLAIALYQQCLNAAKDEGVLQKLAERAEPYFQTLFESELSGEVAESFAHLCCIRKDFSRAAKIVLNLAQKHPESAEEYFFQAALIQAEYNKPLAMQTFSQIVQMGKTKAKEASYNCLVLAFEEGEFEKLVAQKEAFLQTIPEEKALLAHLFLGRSFLALKKYPEAIEELKIYLKAPPSALGEVEKGALLSLLGACFHAEDLQEYEWALNKFESAFAEDPQKPSVLFSYAQILRKKGFLQKAKQTLGTLPAEKMEIAFELLQIEYLSQNWEQAELLASQFLERFGNQTSLASYAWRYEMACLMEQKKTETLVERLEILLQSGTSFTEEEVSEWEFLLAKTQFELGKYTECGSLLDRLALHSPRFPSQANAKLLLAYCHREEKQDLATFCHLAEEALQENATLIEKGPLHAALFNACLQLSQETPSFLQKAEEHLFASFQAGSLIEPQNLLWLIDRFQEKLPRRSCDILDHLIASSQDLLELESLVAKRGRISLFVKEHQKAIELLKPFLNHYTQANLPWEHKEENKLLLAQHLSKIGQKEESRVLLDEILSSLPTLRSETAATAALQRARLGIEKWHEKKGEGQDPEVQKVLVELKNLILQRKLAHEPTHLEAALDYITFQTELEPSETANMKELALLKKTKQDFEQAQDLLSIDYHESLSRLPHKKPIYEGYMEWIQARILFLEGKRDQAKEIFLQIKERAIHPELSQRATQQLEKIEDCEKAPT